MSDSEEICTNFAVARQFDDPSRVLAIRDAFVAIDEERISRPVIDRHLETPLTTREAASLFTCLQKNGTATQISSGGRNYADYTFRIQPAAAVSVLTQQIAVIASQISEGDAVSGASTTAFVATLPGGFVPESVAVQSLPSIADTIRGQVFDAESSVRIANPYFDPSLELIEDLASLPRRGIQTRILTRETADQRGNARTALNKMWKEIGPEQRTQLEVRDLYKWDERSKSQAFATHAKTVIVDESTCYVGSANLTDTSLSTNFEFGVVVEGDTVSDAATLYDEIFEYSRPVDLPIR